MSSRPVPVLAWLLTAALALAPACGSDGGGGAGGDAAEDATPEVTDDAGPGEDTAPGEDTSPGDDAADDAADDVAADVADVPAGPAWALERPQVGEPLTAQEIADFTRAVTGFWKASGYFRWVRMTAHGLDPSNPMGQPDYALWWQDTQAVKEGDTLTFRHTGRADNLTLRTCKVLNNTLAGYLLSGDADMRWVSEQYAKGLVALSRCMQFGEEDPVPYLQARALFTHNHAYETVGGRKVAVDYDPIKRDEESWNAKIVHNPDNPTWGDIWLVNQRSKDDVPHMYRSVPMLVRAAAEAPDASVREAATLALEYLRGFAKDIVDSGYQIRSKFEDGVAVVPTKEDGSVKDLASFVLYEIADPNAECNAKLTSALLAYGEPLGNACGNGDGGVYELLAGAGHYFNYAIIRYFHIAAAANAIVLGYDDLARDLLGGLALKADAILHDEELPNRDEPVWDADAAAFLLAAAAAGLPLTHEEARLVHQQYLLSVEHYAKFDRWDPWDPSVPDGTFDYKPDRGLAVRPTEIGYLLEYCYSPLRDPKGAPLVDCEVIADPSRWGE